jgi:hypothetical protein
MSQVSQSLKKYCKNCLGKAVSSQRGLGQHQPGVLIERPDDGLELLEVVMLGVAGQCQNRALGAVEEGADLAHARQRQVSVRLGPARAGVADHLHLKNRGNVDKALVVAEIMASKAERVTSTSTKKALQKQQQKHEMAGAAAVAEKQLSSSNNSSSN